MGDLNLRDTLATQNFSVQKVMGALYCEFGKSADQIRAMFHVSLETVVNNAQSYNALNEKQQAKAREGAIVALKFVGSYDDSDLFSDRN